MSTWETKFKNDVLDLLKELIEPVGRIHNLTHIPGGITCIPKWITRGCLKESLDELNEAQDELQTLLDRLDRKIAKEKGR